MSNIRYMYESPAWILSINDCVILINPTPAQCEKYPSVVQFYDNSLPITGVSQKFEYCEKHIYLGMCHKRGYLYIYPNKILFPLNIYPEDEQQIIIKLQPKYILRSNGLISTPAESYVRNITAVSC